MARNGTGTYNLPEAPFVYDTTIDEAPVNSNFADIAAALTQSLSKDGQTTPTADLPMGTYKHTGVGNAAARNQYASAAQVQDSALTWCGTATGTADALALTPTPAITAYAAGQRFAFIAGGSPNTGAATVAVSGLAAKAIQLNGAALTANVIEAGKFYEITYDGTQFQIVTSSAALASLYKGATISSAGSMTLYNGLVVKWGSGSSGAAITFATAFPSSVFAVLATPITTLNRSCVVSGVSNAEFTPEVYVADTGVVSPATVYWVAFGV